MANSSFWREKNKEIEERQLKKMIERNLPKVKYETLNNPIAEDEDYIYTELSQHDALTGLTMGHTIICILDGLEYRYRFMPPLWFVDKYGAQLITDRHMNEGVWYLQEERE